MNKDLEIIKKYRAKAAKHVITGIVLECLNIIEAAAEHMAAEIERLEEEKTLLIKFSDEIASHCQRRESEEK